MNTFRPILMLPAMLAVFLSPAAFADTATTETAVPAGAPAAAKPSAVPAAVEVPQSFFVGPSETNPVKDPFFPNSTRFVVVSPGPDKGTNAPPSPPPPPLDFVLNGLAGTADRPLATINNAVFGAGEERELPGATGRRVRVICQEINLTEQFVVIEVGGQQKVLRFGRRK